MVRCIYGFSPEVELLQHHRKASDVTKMACDADLHYTVRLLQSRFASRGEFHKSAVKQEAAILFTYSLFSSGFLVLVVDNCVNAVGI